VAARVLERLGTAVGRAHDEHRLVEDLVLDVVVLVRDLLEPAGHLPHAGPQLLGLPGEELGVVVALLRDAVRDLDRMRHGHEN
jgi:hypothetical protein